MKKFLLLLILIPSVSFSQIQYNTDSSFVFQEVYEVQLSKPEIRKKVNEWIALNFNNSNNVIKLNSEDKIIVKGNLGKPDIDFDLITEFKDGRYKILIDNISELDKPLYYDILYKDGKMLSFEKYLQFSEELIRSSTDIKEKYIRKVLDNETAMKSGYFTTEGILKDWYLDQETIKSKIPLMAKSLYSYIQTDIKSADDW